jgi:hypothetical protein
MNTVERGFVRRWACCTVLSAGALVAPAAVNALLLAHPALATPHEATAVLAAVLAASLCAVPHLFARLFSGH